MQQVIPEEDVLIHKLRQIQNKYDDKYDELVKMDKKLEVLIKDPKYISRKDDLKHLKSRVALIRIKTAKALGLLDHYCRNLSSYKITGDLK